MALKKKPSEPWPLITGEYHVGNPESPVAVCTSGSHLKFDELIKAGAALAGPCKTENIGIEKMTANLVSNPNIRYLIVTGMEVKGHITGQAVEAFLKDGIDKEGKIVGAKGAIPFIQNLNEESIERVRAQVEPVMMMDTEDIGSHFRQDQGAGLQGSRSPRCRSHEDRDQGRRRRRSQLTDQGPWQPRSPRSGRGCALRTRW